MSNLNNLTSIHYHKDHHKKGYKEIGFSYVKVIFKQDGYSITDPLHEEHLYTDNDDEDYEHIVWKNDVPIAEFKYLDDAHLFLKLKLKEN